MQSLYIKIDILSAYPVRLEPNPTNMRKRWADDEVTNIFSCLTKILHKNIQLKTKSKLYMCKKTSD